MNCCYSPYFNVLPASQVALLFEFLVFSPRSQNLQLRALRLRPGLGDDLRDAVDGPGPDLRGALLVEVRAGVVHRDGAEEVVKKLYNNLFLERNVIPGAGNQLVENMTLNRL